MSKKDAIETFSERDDDVDVREIEALLRAEDPGRGAEPELSARGRRRVLWSCRHPILAWCMLHHAWIATGVAVLILSLLYVWLVTKSREVHENNRIPDAVSPPVQLLMPFLEMEDGEKR